MKIAIYSRKSKFTGKGESVENQIQLCKEYIGRNLDCPKNTIIDVYEDEGFSGKNTARPQFQKMMSKARQKYYDYIVCYRLDRISRNVSDFSSLIDELQQYKTSFICIREQFDTSTPMGRAMMYIASVFAQLERETIAERIRDNMLLLARTGRWLGGNTPLGFSSKQVHKDTIDGKVKTSYKLKPIPEEIEIVQYIYDKYIDLRSMAKIEEHLIRRDIKTRKGKYFTPVAIREILSNPVYCMADETVYDYFVKLGADICYDKEEFDGKHGIAAYNRTSHEHVGQTKNNPAAWIISIGRHKGIIDSKCWTEIQVILRANKHGSVHKRVHNPISLLSGLLICDHCGSKMRPRVNSNKGVYANGVQTFSYLCDMKKRSKAQKCNCENLNGNEIDQAVCSTVLNLCKEGSDISKKIVELKNTAVNQRKTSLQMTDSIQVKIQEKEEKIQSLIAVLGKNPNSTTLYKYTELEVDKLDAELKLLNEQLVVWRNEEENANNNCNDTNMIESTIKTVGRAFYQSSIHVKRAFLADLVEKITWDGQKVHIYFFGEKYYYR